MFWFKPKIYTSGNFILPQANFDADKLTVSLYLNHRAHGWVNLGPDEAKSLLDSIKTEIKRLADNKRAKLKTSK